MYTKALQCTLACGLYRMALRRQGTLRQQRQWLRVILPATGPTTQDLAQQLRCPAAYAVAPALFCFVSEAVMLFHQRAELERRGRHRRRTRTSHDVGWRTCVAVFLATSGRADATLGGNAVN